MTLSNETANRSSTDVTLTLTDLPLVFRASLAISLLLAVILCALTLHLRLDSNESASHRCSVAFPSNSPVVPETFKSRRLLSVTSAQSRLSSGSASAQFAVVSGSVTAAEMTASHVNANSLSAQSLSTRSLSASSVSTSSLTAQSLSVAGNTNMDFLNSSRMNALGGLSTVTLSSSVLSSSSLSAGSMAADEFSTESLSVAGLLRANILSVAGAATFQTLSATSLQGDCLSAVSISVASSLTSSQLTVSDLRSGSVSVAGTLTASSVSVTGELSATSLSLSTSLLSDSVSVSTLAQAGTLSSSGALTASQLHTQSLTVDSAVVSGALSADDVISATTLTAGSLSISALTVVASAEFGTAETDTFVSSNLQAGAITSASVSVAGLLTASSLFVVDLAVGSPVIATNLTATSLTYFSTIADPVLSEVTVSGVVQTPDFRSGSLVTPSLTTSQLAIAASLETSSHLTAANVAVSNLLRANSFSVAALTASAGVRSEISGVLSASAVVVTANVNAGTVSTGGGLTAASMVLSTNALTTSSYAVSSVTASSGVQSDVVHSSGWLTASSFVSVGGALTVGDLSTASLTTSSISTGILTVSAGLTSVNGLSVASAIFSGGITNSGAVSTVSLTALNAKIPTLTVSAARVTGSISVTESVETERMRVGGVWTSNRVGEHLSQKQSKAGFAQQTPLRAGATVVHSYTDGDFLSFGFDGMYIYGLGVTTVQRMRVSRRPANGVFQVFAEETLTIDLSSFNGALTFTTSTPWAESAVFDGRYMIFYPYSNSFVARYDTTGPFMEISSWKHVPTAASKVVAGIVTGYTGAQTGFHTLLAGAACQAYAVLPSTVGGTELSSLTGIDLCSGFAISTYFPIATDGRYYYLVPDGALETSGRFIRWDSTLPFATLSSWSSVLKAGFAVGPSAFDGHFIYFANYKDVTPSGGAALQRLDTLSDWTLATSWSTYSYTGQQDCSALVFDGRYLYMLPGYSTVAQTMVSYDTVRSFTDSDSTASAVEGTCVSYNIRSVAYDGRYIFTFGRTEIQAFDTSSPQPLPSLRNIAQSEQLFITSNDQVSIGFKTPTFPFEVQGNVYVSDGVLATIMIKADRLMANKQTVPASTAACTQGRYAFDDNWFYICRGTGFWLRLALT